MLLGTVHVRRRKSGGWKAKARFSDGTRHHPEVGDAMDVTAAYVNLIQLYPDVCSWYICERESIAAAVAASISTPSRKWNVSGLILTSATPLQQPTS